MCFSSFQILSAFSDKELAAYAKAGAVAEEIQVYAPTSKAEEAEVEWFYEDLQDLLKLMPKKDVLFIIGDWNTKVGSQEIPGLTGKFGLGVQNEAGKG